jgi:hypothetical protein
MQFFNLKWWPETPGGLNIANRDAGLFTARDQSTELRSKATSAARM